VDGSRDETRKRELILLAGVGAVVLFVVLVASFAPVGASFRGDATYNCGTPFRRWRSPSALNREWRKDTETIEKAYPATKVSGQTPLVVCADRVQTRLQLVQFVGAVAFLLVVASVAIYWQKYGFINDPHV